MGSSDQEFFVLKWNEFPTNFVSNLQEMRLENDFHDVTLACDEQNFIQGHKVILSASSPYFKAILRRSQPNQHPILLMPTGVRISDLAQVLDFIYYGEIRLSTDDLNSFMALAELLQVRGLTDDDNKQPQPQQHDQPRKFGGPRPLDKSVAKRKGDPNPNPAAPTPTPSIISPPPGTML